MLSFQKILESWIDWAAKSYIFVSLQQLCWTSIFRLHQWHHVPICLLKFSFIGCEKHWFMLHSFLSVTVLFMHINCADIKGRCISKTFNNFNRLNHHWPKILPNLNSYFGKVVRIQIGENFRSAVVQTVEIVKGFWDKSTFTDFHWCPTFLSNRIRAFSRAPLSFKSSRSDNCSKAN